MEQLIEVSHANGAWLVEARGYFEPMIFRSGGQAEKVARRLAHCFAGIGRDARIQVHDRHNALVGAHRYLATPDFALEELPRATSSSTPRRRRAIASRSERISAVS
ncbi:MAG: hypothetical protein JWM33_3484 [Caulobacteraceae bacterium]|nr:hypothetical protein [Caulobacteraceae bacterium]